MKVFFRVLSYLLAGSSALILIDRTPLLLILPKVAVGAVTPFIVVGGWMTALIALARQDRKALAAGLFASLVSLVYIKRVTSPQDGFEEAFGPNWRLRIPPEMKPGMLRSRWNLSQAEPRAVRWHRDVEIGAGSGVGGTLLADVWEPLPGAFRTKLTVLYLHGGAWHFGDKDMLTRPFFRHLAGQGHVIVDLAYTRVPGARLHGQVAEIKRAVAWLKANSDQYGLDPERIVLMGASAGGHLALLTAYTTNHPALNVEGLQGDASVRAVVSYYGITDLTLAYYQWQSRFSDVWTDGTLVGQLLRKVAKVCLRNTRWWPDDGEPVLPYRGTIGLLGGTPEEVPDLYALGSPISHVGSHCPPTLQLQGADDSGIVTSAGHLHDRLTRSGVPSVYMEYPDTEHCFDLILPAVSPAAQSSIYDVERFLALMM